MEKRYIICSKVLTQFTNWLFSYVRSCTVQMVILNEQRINRALRKYQLYTLPRKDDGCTAGIIWLDEIAVTLI